MPVGDLCPQRFERTTVVDQAVRGGATRIAAGLGRQHLPRQGFVDAVARAQAEIALRSASDDDQKQRLRQMIRAIDESSRSAGQLLDHATVIYRTDDLVRTPVMLSDLVSQTVSGLEPTASMKDIRLDVEALRAKAEVDPVLIENALRNVLDNAIKYSPPETVVKVAMAETNDEVRIAVTDQGPGLGEGPADQLTQRFQRGRNTQGIVGSGLGLTIAKDVLVAHGGRLELETLQGGTGTCATLVLPSS